MTAPTGRVGRRRGSAGHAVPALGEPGDLPSARHHLRHPQRRLVRLGAGRQQQHAVETGRERRQGLGQVDHRSRQHPGEEVVQPADHVGDDLHDLRMGVSEHRTHLPAREVEHATAGGVLDEGACRPIGDERRERRAVPHEVTRRPLEISLVRHRPIIARRVAPAIDDRQVSNRPAQPIPDRRLRRDFCGPVRRNPDANGGLAVRLHVRLVSRGVGRRRFRRRCRCRLRRRWFDRAHTTSSTASRVRTPRRMAGSSSRPRRRARRSTGAG